MSKTNWTENQKKAIYTPASVLVNAAAGSGKTAVLVERIIRKIIDEKQDIERLLIVTFARDAAAQMQQRIKKALIKCINNSDDEIFCANMRKQLRALNRSDITTIDAFCINVVRKNFHVLGIDPGFKIIDSEEAKIMRLMALDEFLDSLYEKHDKRIEILSEHYSSGYGDYKLKEIIDKIFEFTRSLPEPKEWLYNSADMYRDFKNSVWFSYLNNRIQKETGKIIEKVNSAAECMMMYVLGYTKDVNELSPEETDALKEYDNKGLWDLVIDDIQACRLLKTGHWDDVWKAIYRFSKVSKSGMSGDFKEERKDIIDKKNEGAELAMSLQSLCMADENSMKKLYEEGIYPVISVLVEVVCEFDDYFLKQKHKKNNYEFNDLEHMCYNLLKNFEDVRNEYAKKYDEILMDEYQDTNALQEGIFDLISDKRFMVGDMKQSIYRFRNSDPLIFKDKDRLFFKSPDKGTRIILSENFRSRPQVLMSINEIFSRIMSESAGEIDYDESQSLKWGNKSYENPHNEQYMSELCILEGRGTESEDDENDVKIEARFIANKIRNMIDEGFLVSDGDNKRPVVPGDFVIILNAVKSVGEIYKEALKKVGLDGYAESVGYFDKIEVKLMLALIEIINNPLQDIPLVAVMRSVLFGFSEDELARIRLTKRGSFFEAVKRAKEEKNELGEKCLAFCQRLEKWRKYAKYMSSDRLIWTIYEETNFYDLMGVLYEGEEAQANLRLLFEKAKLYEKTGFKGLFHFLEYIKRMQKNAKVGGATLISDSKNVVRIMTIHKSKGLEFPVCILGGAGKRFNYSNSTSINIHKDWGIGIDFVDPEKGFFTHTSVQEIINRIQKNEEQAETLRKLYVGMTRAKEKLIVVGTVAGKRIDKDGNESGGYNAALEKWNTLYNPENNVMKPEVVNSAVRFIDILAPVVLSHKKECGWKSTVIPYSPEEDSEVIEDTSFEESEITQESIDSLLGNVYFNEIRPEIPGKISVTGLAKLKERMQTEDDISDFEKERRYTDGLENKKTVLRRPSFLQERGLTGAERGTAYHTFMSLVEINEDMSEEYIKGQMLKIKESGWLSQEELDAVDVVDIVKFFNSELGIRLKKSERILREQPFEVLVNADELLENEKYQEHKILLQGVIDCMFYEDGGFILVDYKTDRGMSEDELISHYKNQIIKYKDAIEKLTNTKVLNAYLYSFEKNREIEIL